MTTYIELHVTMTGDPVAIKPVVENIGWKFSRIDGDPVLGLGVKCYATKQAKYKEDHFEEASRTVLMAGEALRNAGLTVVREKVEVVVFDRIHKPHAGA